MADMEGVEVSLPGYTLSVRSPAVAFFNATLKTEVCEDVNVRLRLYELACSASLLSIQHMLSPRVCITNHRTSSTAGSVHQDPTRTTPQHPRPRATAGLRPNDAHRLRVWIDLLLKGTQDVWSRIRGVCVRGVHAMATYEGPNQHASPLLPHHPSAATVGFAVVDIFRALLMRWGCTTQWYERDGLLQVWLTLMDRAVRDDGTSRRVLHEVALPSLCDRQLCVRESAAEVLGRIADAKPAYASYIVDRVLMELRQTQPVDGQSSLSPTDEDSVYRTEGYLMTLMELLKRGHYTPNDASRVALLNFAAHPASSIRQHVAELLGPPSEEAFVSLMTHISNAHGRSSVGPQPTTTTLSWQVEETLLMALHSHLNHLVGQSRDYQLDLSSIWTTTTFARVTTAATVAFLRFAQSPRFEVARIAQQVLPLFVQAWIRYAPTTVEVCSLILPVCAADHATGILNNNSKNSSPPASGPSLEENVVLPMLWWCVAVRYATHVSSKEDVEEAVRSFGSYAYLRDAGYRPKWLVPTFLIVGTYFFHVSEADVELQATLLKEQTWEDLFQVANIKYLHFAMDYVAARIARGSQRGVFNALTPIWMKYLPSSQTHQQCLLMAMARLASTGLLHGWQVFPFVYRSSYAAPALLDGGEDLLLGYAWLRAFLPTEMDAVRCWSDYAAMCPAWEAEVAGAHGDDVREVGSMEPIMRGMVEPFYIAPGAELDVLREVELLLIALSRQSSEWCVRCVEAVFARLRAVYPTWLSGGGGTGLHPNTSHLYDVVLSTSGCAAGNDWDDDSSEDDHGMAGRSAEEELAAAKNVVAAMVEMEGLTAASPDSPIINPALRELMAKHGREMTAMMVA